MYFILFQLPPCRTCCHLPLPSGRDLGRKMSISMVSGGYVGWGRVEKRREDPLWETQQVCKKANTYSLPSSVLSHHCLLTTTPCRNTHTAAPRPHTDARIRQSAMPPLFASPAYKNKPTVEHYCVLSLFLPSAPPPSRTHKSELQVYFYGTAREPYGSDYG